MVTKKKNTWLNSDGRKLLLRDLKDGTINRTMNWQTVFHTRPEFALGPTNSEALRLFESRFSSAVKINDEKAARAQHEMALLRQDRMVHPIPQKNHRGEPRWDGSEAQKLLKADIKNNAHATLSRMEFYSSRVEYQAWEKEFIDGHVVQEVKLRKFRKQMAVKKGYEDDY
jgi:hypothetical protein